mmetsp:Transcript_9712/g.18403  ORF Transcript_9712/g.18403 Transcript_9712/m.18403 type:complete len:310 (-) Transcript_9712:29-958(-)
MADAVAVHGHTHDVAKHHANDDGLLFSLCILSDLRHGLLEPVHELPVRRSQTQDVAPDLRPRDNVGHDLGEPIVVPVGVDRMARPGLLRSLMQVAHDLAGRDVPQLMVVLGVLRAERLVRGRSHVREALRVVVLGLFSVRELEDDVRVGREEVVIDLPTDLAGQRVEIKLLELDLALSELVVHSRIVVHDLDLELHVLESGYVEREELVVGGVVLVLLLGRDLISEVLVEEGVVLLQLELNVRIRCITESFVGKVGDPNEMDSKGRHDLALLVQYYLQRLLDDGIMNREFRVLCREGCGPRDGIRTLLA